MQNPPTEFFTRDLIQTVSDWQRGGSREQRVQRGQLLKVTTALRPEARLIGFMLK
jgi:hypothetical protein